MLSAPSLYFTAGSLLGMFFWECKQPGMLSHNDALCCRPKARSNHIISQPGELPVEPQSAWSGWSWQQEQDHTVLDPTEIRNFLADLQNHVQVDHELSVHARGQCIQKPSKPRMKGT